MMATSPKIRTFRNDDGGSSIIIVLALTAVLGIMGGVGGRRIIQERRIAKSVYQKAVTRALFDGAVVFIRHRLNRGQAIPKRVYRGVPRQSLVPPKASPTSNATKATTSARPKIVTPSPTSFVITIAPVTRRPGDRVFALTRRDITRHVRFRRQASGWIFDASP